VFGQIVNIIILTFTDANYGDRHNIIVDTVNQSVACATELYFVLVFASMELRCGHPWVQQALSELLLNCSRYGPIFSILSELIH
jgi:hypothetical protein